MNADDLVNQPHGVATSAAANPPPADRATNCTPTMTDRSVKPFPGNMNSTVSAEDNVLMHCVACARPHRKDDPSCFKSIFPFHGFRSVTSRRPSQDSLTSPSPTTAATAPRSSTSSPSNYSLPPQITPEENASPRNEGTDTAFALPLAIAATAQIPSSPPPAPISTTAAPPTGAQQQVHHTSNNSPQHSPASVDELRDFVLRLNQDVRDVALLVSNDGRRQQCLRRVLADLDAALAVVSSAIGEPFVSALYGSQATGLALNTSDVNVTVTHRDPQARAMGLQVPFSALEMLGERLASHHGWFVSRKTLPRIGLTLNAVVRVPEEDPQRHLQFGSSSSPSSPTNTMGSGGTSPTLQQSFVVFITANQWAAVESASLVNRYTRAYSSFRTIALVLKAMCREWVVPREQMNSTVLTFAAMSFYSFHTKSLGRDQPSPGQALFCFLQMFQSEGLFQPRTQLLDPMSSMGILPRSQSSEFQTWYVRNVAPLVESQSNSAAAAPNTNQHQQDSGSFNHNDNNNNISSTTTKSREAHSVAESCFHIHLFRRQLKEAHNAVVQNYLRVSGPSHNKPLRAHLTAVLFPSLERVSWASALAAPPSGKI